jgi:hypothetical protein
MGVHVSRGPVTDIGILFVPPPSPCRHHLALQTLVKRAKHGDDGMDIDRAMMSNIAKRQRFKETDIDPDAEYDFDAGIDL